MKKIIVILIIISSSISQIFAQVGKIEGKLISASGNAGIAFATVKFSNENGVFTDENGEFQIEDLPLGTYNLVVTCIGFEKLDIPSVSCLLYTSPSPRDRTRSRMPSSA